ncbi:hypothetical protein OROMI_016189 [Orobanche minor]
MGWGAVLVSLLCLATFGESTDRLSRFWPVDLSAGTSSLYNWAVTSAAIFVMVAPCSFYVPHFRAFSCVQSARGAEILDRSHSDGSCLCSGIGGEESTIEFMEKQSLATSSIPLLDEAYAYGVVEHSFPLNCFLRDWNLVSLLKWEKTCLNSEIWHACAGPLVSLSSIGSHVVYFPQGHSEQEKALALVKNKLVPDGGEGEDEDGTKKQF